MTLWESEREGENSFFFFFIPEASLCMIHNSGTYFNRLLLCANIWVVPRLPRLSYCCIQGLFSSPSHRDLRSLCAVRGLEPLCRGADCRLADEGPNVLANTWLTCASRLWVLAWTGPYHRCLRPTRPGRVPGSRVTSESARTFKTPSGASPSSVYSSARNLNRLPT